MTKVIISDAINIRKIYTQQGTQLLFLSIFMYGKRIMKLKTIWITKQIETG